MKSSVLKILKKGVDGVQDEVCYFDQKTGRSFEILKVASDLLFLSEFRPNGYRLASGANILSAIECNPNGTKSALIEAYVGKQDVCGSYGQLGWGAIFYRTIEDVADAIEKHIAQNKWYLHSSEITVLKPSIVE